jgi:pimeloyl-ACP methyl ester carboxylesterase
MPQTLDLTAATIDYEDTGADGPVVLFVHGLLVSGTLWRKVVAELDGFRCVVPTMPLGSHRVPAGDRSALTPTGVADLLAEFMERLELTDVTIVANDTGGAITQLLMVRRPERIARVVLTPCDAFENFLPPAFRPLQWAAKARLLAPTLLTMHIRALRPTPLLVPMIEEGRPLTDPVLQLAVKQYLTTMLKHGMKVLVLGCTHYPIIKPLIQQIVGDEVTVIDSAQQCADDVARRLQTAGLLRGGSTDPGTLQCFVTDDTPRFKLLASRFLGTPIQTPTWVSPDDLYNVVHESAGVRKAV